VFRDLVGDGKFVKFDLDGVAQLVETSPPIFKFHGVQVSLSSYPEHMKLETISSVFALNSFALNLMPADFIKELSLPAVPMFVSTMSLSKSSGSGISGVPPMLRDKSDSLKAMQNAEKTQNAKVLLRQDASAILEYFGPLDDISGQRAKSVVLGKLLQTQTELVMMQPQNIPIFLGLFFQRTAVAPKELSSTVTGLHVSHFAKFGTVVNKHYLIVTCVENLIRVLRAFTGGDQDGFITSMFLDMMNKLQSSEEDALKFMDPVLVLDAVSVALTKWSAVLSNPRAMGAREEQILAALDDSLTLDVAEIGRHDNRRFKRKMESQAFRADKVTRVTTGGPPVAGAGGPGQAPGAGKRISYCVAEVSFKLLGGKVFDGRSVLTSCPGKPGGANPFCTFEHKLPSVPVSKSELADLLRTANIITKSQTEKKAALLKVLNAPTFSR
jgi:hypothetical protein